MLVLSRKSGQKLQIGTDITVTILKTQGNTVRLGIEAPRSVRVRRAELPPLGEAKSNKATVKLCSTEKISDEIALTSGISQNGSSAKTNESQVPNTESAVSKTSHPGRWSVSNMEQRARTTESTAPLAAKLAAI